LLLCPSSLLQRWTMAMALLTLTSSAVEQLQKHQSPQ
jgi:hypothetical protein